MMATTPRSGGVELKWCSVFFDLERAEVDGFLVGGVRESSVEEGGQRRQPP